MAYIGAYSIYYIVFHALNFQDEKGILIQKKCEFSLVYSDSTRREEHACVGHELGAFEFWPENTTFSAIMLIFSLLEANPIAPLPNPLWFAQLSSIGQILVFTIQNVGPTESCPLLGVEKGLKMLSKL